MKRAHVIGAGLSGLSAAVRLTQAGFAVELSDAAPQAGGRCRSWRDEQLGLTIDNGNHLVLSGNQAVMDYLRLTGGSGALIGPAEARFPWVDARTGERWVLRPNMGRFGWWVTRPDRRVPGTRTADYLAFARLLGVRTDAPVAATLDATGPLWERLLEPFLVSALNTPARDGSARLAGAVIRGSLAKGGRASLPRVAHPTLAAAFVDPALRWLGEHSGQVRLGRRLRSIRTEHGRVTGLIFADGEVAVDGPVILATPAAIAAEIVPGLSVPTEHNAILNAHFAAPPPPRAELLTGIVGGTAEWVFALPDRISTTTSAADRLLGQDRDVLAERLWRDAALALALAPRTPVPPYRIVAEKRATFAATPEQDRLRPGPRSPTASNLLLAGDWTQTGLPATIEGAIRSGVAAASLARSVCTA